MQFEDANMRVQAETHGDRKHNQKEVITRVSKRRVRECECGRRVGVLISQLQCGQRALRAKKVGTYHDQRKIVENKEVIIDNHHTVAHSKTIKYQIKNGQRQSGFVLDQPRGHQTQTACASRPAPQTATV